MFVLRVCPSFWSWSSSASFSSSYNLATSFLFRFFPPPPTPPTSWMNIFRMISYSPWHRVCRTHRHLNLTWIFRLSLDQQLLALSSTPRLVQEWCWPQCEWIVVGKITSHRRTRGGTADKELERSKHRHSGRSWNGHWTCQSADDASQILAAFTRQFSSLQWRKILSCCISFQKSKSIFYHAVYLIWFWIGDWQYDTI